MRVESKAMPQLVFNTCDTHQTACIRALGLCVTPSMAVISIIDSK
jgi:hypothetical protein